MKQVLGLYGNAQPHWVGDGFPVRSLFSHHRLGAQLSPFLMLDHAGPIDFPPARRPRGVGAHPHRGFETVTIVYSGEVAHRDSTGQGGVIGPGDVQWMTAGEGILHEEFHSPAFTGSGGRLEMVQLWVNLPARHKMTAPGYQGIQASRIPVVPLPGDTGSLRVIAGEYQGTVGPARTFTPINVWDLSLHRDRELSLSVPEGHTAAVVVLQGTVLVNGRQVAREAQMVLLERAGSDLSLEANGDARLLLLGGEPIDEPIVGHGPFVMNSPAEIERAINDFRLGKFGRIAG